VSIRSTESHTRRIINYCQPCPTSHAGMLVPPRNHPLHPTRDPALTNQKMSHSPDQLCFAFAFLRLNNCLKALHDSILVVVVPLRSARICSLTDADYRSNPVPLKHTVLRTGGSKGNPTQCKQGNRPCSMFLSSNRCKVVALLYRNFNTLPAVIARFMKRTTTLQMTAAQLPVDVCVSLMQHPFQYAHYCIPKSNAERPLFYHGLLLSRLLLDD
jgi:hypothetical protein